MWSEEITNGSYLVDIRTHNNWVLNYGPVSNPCPWTKDWTFDTAILIVKDQDFDE